MSKIFTTGARSDDDMPSLNADRFRIVGRGRFAKRKVELPLAGVRQAVGMTQVQVAEAAGMPQGDISRLEGKDDMLLSTLERYASALGVELDVAFVLPNGARIHLSRGTKGR